MKDYSGFTPKEPKRVPSGSNKGTFQSRYSPQGGGNGLRAEKRQDKDGKIVTRWVKDGSDNSPSAALSQAGVGGGAAVPTNVNWDATSPERAAKLVATVASDLDNPDKLWENIDFYTGMLESKHSDAALTSMNTDGVGRRLREAWLGKHGLSVTDRDTYQHIGGDEGYDAYKSAYTALGKAGADAQAKQGLSLSHDERGNAIIDSAGPVGPLDANARSKASEVYESVTNRMRITPAGTSGGGLPVSHHSDPEPRNHDDVTARAANSVLDDLESGNETSGLPNWSADQKSAQADRLRDWMDRSGIETEEASGLSTPEPKNGDAETAKAANAVLGDLEGGSGESGLPNWSDSEKSNQADRLRDWMSRSNIEVEKEDEIPEDSGGKTVAWSDMNPFRGWGKKK